MTVIVVAVVALVVVGVVALLRRGPTTAVSGSKMTPPSAEKVLDQRFARGEIDAQEYQTRRSALRAAQDH